MSYTITSPFKPAGDQPEAINKIIHRFSNGIKRQVLLGATGTGKTFTMANVIANLDCSCLIIAPNKTLAAQLYSEFKSLMNHNAVGFFISYYDYYQPEAYIPSLDRYIEKDSSINDDIDKMRHEATRFLFEEQRTVIVASVSCIYGLGSPQAYAKNVLAIKVGMKIPRDKFLRQLVDIQYSRNDRDFDRGSFRVRGERVDIIMAHQTDEAVRVEFFGEEIEAITLFDPISGSTIRSLKEVSLFPNSHYVPDQNDLKDIIRQILQDLGKRLIELKSQNRLVEYQRLEQRTMKDIETLEQLGFCPGIENYTRYLSGKKAGEPPPCLLDYFPKDFLTIIDESHITMPQISGMFRGDRARKSTLVDYGFRLPSALDNRPLNFEEFLGRTDKMLYVSATPAAFELTEGPIAEQIIRPTGLLDPVIEVRSTENQVDDLLVLIRQTTSRGGRVLVTCLTKVMSEELCKFYENLGVKVRYLHSDIVSLERATILRDLRRGEFDVLIGINLLREGLDLPEVQLVAVMDADKEGFLRSRASLIQIVGRAARNEMAKVIFYGKNITKSMAQAMDETSRRREIQMQYNELHGITPTTIIKDVPADLRTLYGLIQKDEEFTQVDSPLEKLNKLGISTSVQLDKLIKQKKKQMKDHAALLEFEQAASLREEVKELVSMLMVFSPEIDKDDPFEKI